MKTFTTIIFLLFTVLLSAQQTPAERLHQLFEEDKAFLKKEFYELETPFPSVSWAGFMRHTGASIRPMPCAASFPASSRRWHPSF